MKDLRKKSDVAGTSKIAIPEDKKAQLIKRYEKSLVPLVEQSTLNI